MTGVQGYMGRLHNLGERVGGCLGNAFTYWLMFAFGGGLLINLWKEREQVKDTLFFVFFVAVAVIVGRAIYEGIRGK